VQNANFIDFGCSDQKARSSFHTSFRRQPISNQAERVWILPKGSNCTMRPMQILLTAVVLGYGLAGAAAWLVSAVIDHTFLLTIIFFVLSGIFTLLLVLVAHILVPEEPRTLAERQGPRPI
jgi:hypothetical protein